MAGCGSARGLQRTYRTCTVGVVVHAIRCVEAVQGAISTMFEGKIIMCTDIRQILMIFTCSAILIYAIAAPWFFALFAR